MDSKEERLIKRIVPCVLGIIFLTLAAAGTLKTIILETKGLKAEARIAEIRKVRPYSAVNRLRPPEYEITFLYQDQNGIPQKLNAKISESDKNRWIVPGIPTVPIIYVPDGKSYAIGELPHRGWTIGALALLIPGALYFFYRSFTGK